MSELVFVKIGGAIATDKEKEATLRPDVLAEIASALKSAIDEGGVQLLLGHGGGSFGHFPARKYEVRRGVHPKWGFDGFQITRGWMEELNGKVLAAFAAKGVKLYPVQPSSCLVAEAGRIATFETGPMEVLFAHKRIPVVWGDAVLDSALGFTIVSTEALFAHLAGKFKPARVLVLTDVDGVFRSPEQAHSDGFAPIPSVDRPAFESMRESLREITGVDVTGGMLEKVEKLLRVAEASPGSEVRILNGRNFPAIRDAVLGRFSGGTVVRA